MENRYRGNEDLMAARDGVETVSVRGVKSSVSQLATVGPHDKFSDLWDKGAYRYERKLKNKTSAKCIYIYLC